MRVEEGDRVGGRAVGEVLGRGCGGGVVTGGYAPLRERPSERQKRLDCRRRGVANASVASSTTLDKSE